MVKNSKNFKITKKKVENENGLVLILESKLRIIMKKKLITHMCILH